MVDPIRQEVVATARTVVIKVGTNVLTGPTGLLDHARIQALADQLQRLRQTGRNVVLVSSGAIGAGVGRLGLSRRPTDLRQLQACAAVGQTALMQAYQTALEPQGVHAAQILLTASDFDSRARYLNARNTVLALLEWGCLPIINENDTVSVAEIKFGDNDHLAALVSNLIRADLLILLTNVDGLYSADPNVDPSATILGTVREIDASVAGLAGATKSALGTGGMRSKLRAARLVTAAGEAVVMANGSRDSVIDAVMGGEAVGTLFLPHGGLLTARQRWIGSTARPKGRVLVDAGAMRAVREGGRSLLPVGVSRVVGTFGKGDVIAICDADGVEFARGLTNYTSADAERVRGMRAERLAETLGRRAYDELVHRDNLVVLG